MTPEFYQLSKHVLPVVDVEKTFAVVDLSHIYPCDSLENVS